MAKDNHRGADDLDESDESSHAADEPTAVWDLDALRRAGLSEVMDAPETPGLGPATSATSNEAERPSIIVAQEARAPVVARPAPRQQVSRKSESADVGWAGLITMAALLGAVAYVVMRLLR